MEKMKMIKEDQKTATCKNGQDEDNKKLLSLLVEEPISVDVGQEERDNIGLGDKIADKITMMIGSWLFILISIAFLITWVVLNLCVFENLDPYPFILLNLVLSCIAALQAPIIMMSQNRQTKRDSLRSKNDYRTDLKSELILEELYDKMEKMEENQKQILEELEAITEKYGA